MKQYLPISVEKERELMKEKPRYHWFEVNNGKKHFLEFGVSHSRDVNHPQFEIIKNLIYSFKPQAVLFETSQKNIDEAKKMKLEESIFKYLEMGIISIMLDKKTKRIGADLRRSDLYIKEITSKYSEEDINIEGVLCGLRYHAKRDKSKPCEIFFNNPLFEKDQHYLPKIREYVQLMEGKSFEDLTYKDGIDPTPIDNKCVLNNISRDLSDLRDNHMVQIVIETLNKYNRVMFFVGRNHVLRHEDYLREAISKIN